MQKYCASQLLQKGEQYTGYLEVLLYALLNFCVCIQLPNPKTFSEFPEM